MHPARCAAAHDGPFITPPAGYLSGGFKGFQNGTHPRLAHLLDRSGPLLSRSLQLTAALSRRVTGTHLTTPPAATPRPSLPWSRSSVSTKHEGRHPSFADRPQRRSAVIGLPNCRTAGCRHSSGGAGEGAVIGTSSAFGGAGCGCGAGVACSSGDLPGHYDAVPAGDQHHPGGVDAAAVLRRGDCLHAGIGDGVWVGNADQQPTPCADACTSTCPAWRGCHSFAASAYRTNRGLAAAEPCVEGLVAPDAKVRFSLLAHFQTAVFRYTRPECCGATLLRVTSLMPLLILTLVQSAAAADPAAQFITKLFIDVCVPQPRPTGWGQRVGAGASIAAN